MLPLEISQPIYNKNANKMYKNKSCQENNTLKPEIRRLTPETMLQS